jgi:hypothetical protein
MVAIPTAQHGCKIEKKSGLFAVGECRQVQGLRSQQESGMNQPDHRRQMS